MPNCSDAKRPKAYWRPYFQAAGDVQLPCIERGKGLSLYDTQGEEYLDAISGSYNHCFGHSDDGLLEAIRDQMGKLLHVCSVTVETPLTEALARKLVEAVGLPNLNHVFLTLSGSEGVEAALKMAWMHRANRRTTRRKIASLEDAYHGCTLGALLATQRAFSKDGIPIVAEENSIAVPPPHRGGDLSMWKELLEAQGEQIAAIVIEPVMGLGGAIEHPAGFLRGLCELARQYGVLTICDEVFCGMGRAGSICESKTQGAAPDVIVFSKNLGAGIPVTAVLASSSVFEGFLGPSVLDAYRSGHTHSGHLLGCAAANYVLDRLCAEDWCRQVRAKGAALLDSLRAALSSHRDVRVVRGKGLMLAVECSSFEACAAIQERARRKRLLLGSTGMHLKICPAYTINEQESARLVDVLSASMA